VVESLANLLIVGLVATTIDPVFSVPPVFRSLIMVRAFYVMIWLRLLLVMWSFVSRFCLCLARIVWFFVIVVVVVFACSHSLSIFFLLCPIAMGCVRKPALDEAFLVVPFSFCWFIGHEVSGGGLLGIFKKDLYL
jgi:hypothetical protein